MCAFLREYEFPVFLFFYTQAAASERSLWIARIETAVLPVVMVDLQIVWLSVRLIIDNNRITEPDCRLFAFFGVCLSVSSRVKMMC